MKARTRFRFGRVGDFVLVVGLSIAPSLAWPNEAHDIISAMSETDRRVALASFMRTSGESCARATRTFFQGFDKSGNAFWNVGCSNGRSFSVMIYNDSVGSTRILDCKVLKALTKVECFKKF